MTGMELVYGVVGFLFGWTVFAFVLFVKMDRAKKEIQQARILQAHALSVVQRADNGEKSRARRLLCDDHRPLPGRH